MRLLRAILFGALLWVLIFFEVSILMFGFGLQAGMNSYVIAHAILLTLLTVVVALLYFRGKGIRAGFWEGLSVGLVFLATGIILDLLVTVPLFVKSYLLFFTPCMLLGYLQGVLVVTIVGTAKGRRKR